MRKCVLILIGIILLFGFKKDQQRLYKIQADLSQWNEIIDVIDLSEADAKKRVAVKQFIIRQLQDTVLNKK